MKQTDNQTCDICYKICCKQCGWIANNSEVELIQKRKLTACPICGWKPE